MAGKTTVAAATLFTLLAGMVFGAILFNHYYKLSVILLEKYNLFVMLFSAMAMFVSGFFVGKSGNSKAEVQYKPHFQGQPQRLGREGDKLIFASLKRSGLIKESEKRG